MELLYLYIEDTFGMKVSFSERDLNFKGDQHFFKEGNSFMVQENAEFYENLYSDKLTMTAIVGENGTGKTT